MNAKILLWAAVVAMAFLFIPVLMRQKTKDYQGDAMRAIIRPATQGDLAEFKRRADAGYFTNEKYDSNQAGEELALRGRHPTTGTAD